MAFTQGNNEEYKLYTGVADCFIVAINPTDEELKAMGITPKAPVKYIEELTGTDGSVSKRVSIDFWLRHKDPDILVKIRFFLEDKIKTSIDGTKNRYINDFGQNFYGTSIDDLPKASATGVTWIEKANIRECLIGEAEIVDFIRTWFAAGAKDVSKFDNIKALFEGDFTELKGYAKEGKLKKIQVLLYVNDNGYQSVFTRHFARAFNKRADRWMKSLEGSKINYQNSLVLQEMNQLTGASAPPPAPNAAEDPFS